MRLPTALPDPAGEQLATVERKRSAEVAAEGPLEASTAALPRVEVRAEADQQGSSEAELVATLKSAVEDAPAMPDRVCDAIRFLDALTDVFDNARALDTEHVGAASEQSMRSDSEQ